MGNNIQRKRELPHTLADIASIENLLEAWKEFLPGKKQKPDVQEFSLRLMDNILALHFDLINSPPDSNFECGGRTYRHGGYRHFRISDPKPRDIHKASVRDRLLHHAIYRILYPFFDRIFIADSFSCREGRGTHKALERYREFSRQLSHNNMRTAWVLKCDIRKFFANINHEVLLLILRSRIPDECILQLLGEVIGSFSTEGKSGIGLPLGNLTSQLLVNIYMNEFDQFVKHKLKVKYYIRYADDFVIFSINKTWIEDLLPRLGDFLRSALELQLHPDKVRIKTAASGVDFLGWVHFPTHRVLRTATRRRMARRLRGSVFPEAVASYRGLLRHGNARKLERKFFYAALL